MKAVKIILAIAVLGIIGFFLTKWFTKIDDIDDGSIFSLTNQYNEEIQSKDNENKQVIRDQQINNTQNRPNAQPQKQQPRTNSLEQEFWDLVHSGNAKKESYDRLLRKYKSKKGDIIAYLSKICKDSNSFKKFKDIPELDRRDATTLTEIDIN